jgi:hypothetical protein
MAESIFDKVKQALKQAENHNSNLMVKPEVILWLDPDNHWTDVIEVLQGELPQLLIYGDYAPSKKKGPSIWIKCMVAKMLPEANWPNGLIPIIYLPGFSKNDFRNVEEAGLNLQPLIEYQYTGVLFLQENGKEWTILAFLENPINGLGLKVAKDSATKEALKKSLPVTFQDADVFQGRSILDEDYLNNLLFPDLTPNILKWMCKGDVFLKQMDDVRREVFINLCKNQYEFDPDHRDIISISRKLGEQKGNWRYIWQMYANAPKKYPEIEEFLRSAKPDDLSVGVFAIPEESWPQVNELAEDKLLSDLTKVASLHPKEATQKLISLEDANRKRIGWIWNELGKSPLVNSLYFLVEMAKICTNAFPISSIEELKEYYTSKGIHADQNMRKALASVKSEKDKKAIKSIIKVIYQPWLELITNQFQTLVTKNADIFTKQLAKEEKESYILFVDAFRYELAEEFCKRLEKLKYKVDLFNGWSAIPSLTPTAKPNISPIVKSVSTVSEISEFRPQLINGKDLQTAAFREQLSANGFKYISNSNDIDSSVKSWQEIGDIDTKGHEEQSDMVKRIDELFEQVLETIDVAFEKGVKRIKIVTDHGWLLMPGGLPKTQLNSGLAETRWGRCAIIKDGAKTDLLHLPWRWNPNIFIAYAPGINFFKMNEEYAHGGISIHECLVPEIIIENPNAQNIDTEFKEVKWVNLKCAIQTTNVPDGFKIDIRTKYNDSLTSVLDVSSKDKKIIGNMVTLLIDDAYEYQSATIVLLDESDRILNKKPTSIGG